MDSSDTADEKTVLLGNDNNKQPSSIPPHLKRPLQPCNSWAPTTSTRNGLSNPPSDLAIQVDEKFKPMASASLEQQVAKFHAQTRIALRTQSMDPDHPHLQDCGCLLLENLGQSVKGALVTAVGVAMEDSAHSHCVKRGRGPPGDSWKLDLEHYTSKIVPTDTPEFKKLKRDVRAFYFRQNDIIHSFVECERRFRGYTGEVEESVEEAESTTRLAMHISNAFNMILTLAKVLVSYVSGSLAIVSSLVDSMVDLFTGLALWFTSHRIRNHNPYLFPIGRRQLEPLAIILCSAVMGMASLQLIVESARRLAANDISVNMDYTSLGIMAATVGAKGVLFVYCRRIATPISQTLALDHLNDVISNVGAVAGAYCASRLWAPLDPIFAILMALYILYRHTHTHAHACGRAYKHAQTHACALSWCQTGYEEMLGLSGHSADPDFLKTLTWVACNHHPAIVVVETVSAYHVGPKMIAEVDIVLCPYTPLPVAHDIAETLQMKYEALEEIERAFVHIDFEVLHDRRWEHMRHL